jgi:hypothetical protein
MRTSSTLALFHRQATPVRRRVFSARRLQVLAGAALVVTALALLFASPSPGAAIREDLGAAAAIAGTMPAKTKPEAVVQAMHAVFPGRTLTVDADAFPAVIYVTLRALDKENCAALLASARRIEGLVVIDLEHYRSAADCRDSNDMTWRIMP